MLALRSLFSEVVQIFFISHLKVLNFAFHIWSFKSPEIDFYQWCEIRIFCPLFPTWITNTANTAMDWSIPSLPYGNALSYMRFPQGPDLFLGSILCHWFIFLSLCQCHPVQITIIQKMSGYQAG